MFIRTQEMSCGSGLPTRESWPGSALWTLSGAQVRGWMSIRTLNDKRLCPVTVNSCHGAEVVEIVARQLPYYQKSLVNRSQKGCVGKPSDSEWLTTSRLVHRVGFTLVS